LTTRAGIIRNENRNRQINNKINTKTDAEPLTALWTDPDVTRYMGGPRNYEEVLKSFREDAQVNPTPVFDLWPVIEKRTRRLIGNCGIIEKNVEGKNEHEIIYVLAKSAWGKGFATEAADSLKNYAFKRLGLERIIALIDNDNLQAEKIADKIGLKYEKYTVRLSGKKMRVFSVITFPFSRKRKRNCNLRWPILPVSFPKNCKSPIITPNSQCLFCALTLSTIQ